MKFKIQHENRKQDLYVIVLMILLFLTVLTPLGDIFVLQFPILLGIFGVGIYKISSRAIKTTVTIDGDTMKIRHILLTRTVNIYDITELRLEHYNRRRSRGRYHHYTEHRVAMIVTVGGEQPKTFELTDNTEPTPEIPLFSVTYSSAIKKMYDSMKDGCQLYNLYNELRGVTGLAVDIT